MGKTVRGQKSRKKHSSLKSIPDEVCITTVIYQYLTNLRFQSIGNGEFRVQKTIATAASVGPSEHVLDLSSSPAAVAGFDQSELAAPSYLSATSSLTQRSTSSSSGTPSRSSRGHAIAPSGPSSRSPHSIGPTGSRRFSPYVRTSPFPRVPATHVRDVGLLPPPEPTVPDHPLPYQPSNTSNSFPAATPRRALDSPSYAHQVILHNNRHYDTAPAVLSTLPYSLSPGITSQLYHLEDQAGAYHQPAITHPHHSNQSPGSTVASLNETYPTWSLFEQSNQSAEAIRLDSVDVDVPAHLQFFGADGAQLYGQNQGSDSASMRRYNDFSRDFARVDMAKFSGTGVEQMYPHHRGDRVYPANQDAGPSSMPHVQHDSRYYSGYDEESSAADQPEPWNWDTGISDIVNPFLPGQFPPSY